MTGCDIFIDGACSGNPGPAGIGVSITRNGESLKNVSRFIGEATNNIAEYSALICALEEALLMKLPDIRIFTDSELVYKQIIGAYKIKNEKLQVLNAQAKRLMQGFEKISITHIVREKNKAADHLATSAIKCHKAQNGCPGDLFGAGEESPSSKG